MITLRGELHVTVNNVTGHLIAEEQTLRLELDDPVAFLRQSQLFQRSSLGALRFLAEQLDQNSLTLSIASRGQVLVVIGKEAKSGMAGSLIGVPHLEVQALAMISRIAS